MINDTKHYLIVRNDDANDFNPGKFSENSNGTGRMVCSFIVSRCSMGIRCGSGKFTKIPAADTSDANDKGCGSKGQFPWSELILIWR